MCPELGITGDQVKEINRWVKSQPNSRYRGSHLDGAPGMGVSVYDVNGEPLIIYTDTGLFGGFTNKIQKGRLLCSDKHAQELEKTGIIKLPEPPQKASEQ